MKLKTQSKKNRPLFRRIIFPLMALLAIEIIIFATAFLTSGLVPQFRKYAQDVAEGKLNARQNYLESAMVHNWMNLSDSVDSLNELMKEKLESGELTLDDINKSGKATTDFLVDASGILVKNMRANRVTGSFLILGTKDLGNPEDKATLEDKPGLYFRDLDPLSTPSTKNTDLLIERSPAEVIRAMGIATDSSWSPNFRFATDGVPYYSYYYAPFMAAYNDHGQTSWKDLGYWGSPDKIQKENRLTITYSVPLVLEDGTVYGVLGVDLTEDYLKSYLPADELTDGKNGGYFIAQTDDTGEQFTEILGTGKLDWVGNREDTYTNSPAEEKTYVKPDSKYYVKTLDLNIYNSNVVYQDTKWVFGVSITEKSIDSHANRIRMVFFLAAAAVILMGFLGSIFIAYWIQKPILNLEAQIEEADTNRLVKLEPTGIREIDNFSEAIESLSRDVIASGKKFSKILRMASKDMGGFQYEYDTDTLFVTENFFGVFGLVAGEDNVPKLEELNIESFKEVMYRFAECKVEDENFGGDVYEIEKDGKKRYVRLRISREANVSYGLAEDITTELLHSRMIIFERDHDALTGLYNRKAFRGKITDQMEEMGEDKNVVGALLMMDLDNLKSVNDSYGHEVGDAYIRAAANTLTNTMTKNALVSRISGDEFNVFIYGESRVELEAEIQKLKDAFVSVYIPLNNGDSRPVQISAGIAWYPQDATGYESLQRFADSALYIAKKNRKGTFATFDLKQYQGEDEIRRKKEALVEFLEFKKFHYAFMPIVDAHTGEEFAYEALMRPDTEQLKNPLEVLDTARNEGKLNQIENVTVPASIERFFELQDTGVIGKNIKMFFNTISNQILADKVSDGIIAKFGQRLENLVCEITEEEAVDYSEWDKKIAWLNRANAAIALDDYGTGYNSEKTLLHVSPQYIKVDIAIVKNIQNSPDKRAIMEYIVNFAHDRGRFIIAEGVETEEETRECIRLGVDFLQGYFIEKAQAVPQPMSEEFKTKIREMNQ